MLIRKQILDTVEFPVRIDLLHIVCQSRGKQDMPFTGNINLQVEKVIGTGVTVRKSKDSTLCKIPYEIRILDTSYLSEIIRLQQVIIEGLPRTDMLQPFSECFMKEHIGERGFILGVVSGSSLIAFRNVYFPDMDDPEWNLGIDLGLPESSLCKVANFQLVCVHPDFLGNSLALVMNRHAISILRRMETYEHLCATVSPYNFWNVKILLESGFVIKKLMIKYGGKLRYLVHQNLKNPGMSPSDPELMVSLTDFVKQEKLFNAGWLGTMLAGRQVRENGSAERPNTTFENTLRNLEIGFVNKL